MKKSAAGFAFLSVMSMAASSLAFSATFLPSNIPVTATGQIIINPNTPGAGNNIACNAVLSGNVNAYGNLIFNSAYLSGAPGCSSIFIGVADFVPVSGNQVSVGMNITDMPKPLQYIFACQGSTQGVASWNNATSQIIFNNTQISICVLNGALTINPAITIQ